MSPGQPEQGAPHSQSFWKWLCPASGVTDSWQLPAEGDLPVPSLVQCATEPVQPAKQAKPNLTAGFAAVLTGSGRPHQELLLVQIRGKEKGMEPLLLWE